MAKPESDYGFAFSALTGPGGVGSHRLQAHALPDSLSHLKNVLDGAIVETNTLTGGTSKYAGAQQKVGDEVNQFHGAHHAPTKAPAAEAALAAAPTTPKPKSRTFDGPGIG